MPSGVPSRVCAHFLYGLTGRKKLRIGIGWALGSQRNAQCYIAFGVRSADSRLRGSASLGSFRPKGPR